MLRATHGSATDETTSAPLVLEPGDRLEVSAVIGFGRNEAGVNGGLEVTFAPGTPEAETMLLDRIVVREAGRFLLTGPLEVRALARGDGGYLLATFELTRMEETPALLPVNTVVLPTDATGDMQVILESSADLVNWTPALPGPCSSATEQRFFRLRVVMGAN